MSNIPFRNVGLLGVIKDQEPFNLEPGAWSDSRNVSFNDGSCSRSPIFRDAYTGSLYSTTAALAPVGGFLYRIPGGNRVITVSRDYHLTEWQTDGTLVDVTPTGWTTTTEYPDRITSAFIGGVTYCNRDTDVPICRTPADSLFAAIPDWPSDYTCKSLREFKSILIALNVTKGVVENPAMYKWSHEIQYGEPPPSWDLDAEDIIAGENVLNDTKSGLVDGMTLGDYFMMYTSTESFIVEFVGDIDILKPRKLFSDDGVIAVNCAVEVDGKHFVFGTKDIYIHDGISKKSIAEGRIKKHLYSILDFENRDRCYVSYDKFRGEVQFAFPTLIDEAYRSPTSDCTMAYVYNIEKDTWGLVDLPWGVASVEIEVDPSTIWEDLDGQSWSDLDGAWTSFGTTGGTALATVSAGTLDTNARPRILPMDEAYKGRLSAPPAEGFTPDSYVERTGLDMDEIGADILGRKLIRCLLPQGATASPETPVRVRIGGSPYSGRDPNFGPAMLFYPDREYKVDTRVNDRYLALRFEGNEGEYWKVSGFDLDMVRIAGR